MDWIYLAQYRDHCRACVNMVVGTASDFIGIWTGVRFWRKGLLHGLFPSIHFIGGKKF